MGEAVRIRPFIRIDRSCSMTELDKNVLRELRGRIRRANRRKTALCKRKNNAPDRLNHQNGRIPSPKFATTRRKHFPATRKIRHKPFPKNQ